MSKIIPSFLYENQIARKHGIIAGVDEVGVGPLAGPVVAAAVVLENAEHQREGDAWWYEARDSKQLRHTARERLASMIVERCVSFGIGSSTVAEIDELNILQARLLAMKRAVENLRIVPHALLVDGTYAIPDLSMEQYCLVRGDSLSVSVACASILAKVTRDNLLNKLHEQFPEYGFDKHKGYPTKLHHQKLKQFGPCSEHRRSYQPVRLYESLRKPLVEAALEQEE